jgi:rubrerythrin
MITKEDVKEMIGEIKKLEMQMHKIYENLLNHISDEKLKKDFTTMKEEELVHFDRAQELEDLLVSRWRSLD